MTTLNIKPLGARILVKRCKAESSKGGILLPESAKEKPRKGTVLEVGPGTVNEAGTLEALQVKKGDCVLFSSYSGNEVKLGSESDGEEELLILSESDVLGILS